MPGGDLLKLDTVVVDAEVNEDGVYDNAILYSCVDAVDEVPVIEFNVIARNDNMSTDDLNKIIAKAE